MAPNYSNNPASPMNRFQLVVVVVAAVNVLLMLLFPPFLNNPIGLLSPRGFDGFYFFFSAPAGHPIQAELLTIEVLFVVANALTAWLVLADRGRPARRAASPEARLTAGVLAFGAANFALILLFPPFEAYQSLVRVPPVGFDGFYFAFGDKMHRPIFAPLLQLECILVAVDLLSAWLLLGVASRRLSESEERLLSIARNLSAEQRAALEESLVRATVEPQARRTEVGRGPDRRRGPDPAYQGPERRRGNRRRAA
jgi:hypothetical protein